jgi:hypothetical protein
MADHPERVRQRLVPDAVQLQIILGSLLGDACLEGGRGARRMHISEVSERADYVRWKYERLGPFADEPPVPNGPRIGFRTIAHPIFDDLAPLLAHGRARVTRLLSPLGVAVWMTDAGRLELRPEIFLVRPDATLRAA